MRHMGPGQWQLALFFKPLFQQEWFSDAFREGRISGVAKDDDNKDYNNDEIPKPEPNHKPITEPNPEEPDDLPGISLEPSASCGEVVGVYPP